MNQAIRNGDMDKVTAWLNTLPPGDKRGDELNKAKFDSPWGTRSTVLHLAAQSNQVDIAVKLLAEGSGIQQCRQ